MAKVHSEVPSELPPDEGAKLVWNSVPTGRGTVTERVITSEPGATFVTRVFDERAVAVQTVKFTEEATAIELDYALQSKTPLNRLVDVLFIRRAQRDALARTLRRFAIEAAEQAAL